MRKPPLRVAIVDDDESVRKALARLLLASAFNIDTFSSAQEFLVSLRAHTPDCLVLDLQMPDVGGLDLQRHLRRNGIVLPTVIITAHNEAGASECCLAAGVAAYLIKPLDASALIDAITAATANGENCDSSP